MTTMNTPQITPTPDAVKLAGELAVKAAASTWCYLKGGSAGTYDEYQWFRNNLTLGGPAHCIKQVADILLPVLTAQQAEHAATVARLERERDEVITALSLREDASNIADTEAYKTAELLAKLRADLAAARAEVERWKRDKDDAEERLIPLIELVEKHTLESEDSFDTEDVLEGHYKDRAQFRAQLTALRERAEGLAGAMARVQKATIDHDSAFTEYGEAWNEAVGQLSAYRAASDSARDGEGEG